MSEDSLPLHLKLSKSIGPDPFPYLVKALMIGKCSTLILYITHFNVIQYFSYNLPVPVKLSCLQMT